MSLLRWKIVKSGQLIRRWFISVEKHCDYTDAEEFDAAIRYIWKQKEVPSNKVKDWFEKYMDDLKEYENRKETV